MNLKIHDWHNKHAKKMSDFAGYRMPTWYSSIKEEHLAVRNNIGLFDVSHMGTILVEGTDALAFLQYLTTNDISKPPPISATYSLILNERGAIKDECLVYHMEENRYMVIFDAVAVEKIYAWFSLFEKFYDITLTDKSYETQIYAIQGPKAHLLCKDLFEIDIADMWWFQAARTMYDGVDIIVSKSGYTGENGVEVLFDADAAYSRKFWEAILEKGKKYGITPCGLGARDSLRIEAGYALYGEDVKEKQLLSTGIDSMNPLETGGDFALFFDKVFIGKKALEKAEPKKKIRHLIMKERGIPRAGCTVFAGKKAVGEVTSGTQSIMSGDGIGFCFVDADTAVGDKVYIEIRGKKKEGEIVKPPFYDSKKYGAFREG